MDVGKVGKGRGLIKQVLEIDLTKINNPLDHLRGFIRQQRSEGKRVLVLYGSEGIYYLGIQEVGIN